MKTAIGLIAGLMTLTSLTGCAGGSENGEKSTIESIMTRTSVRSFTAEKVSKDNIETLLRAGMAAPSAVNKQPWHFIAVTNQALLDSLAKANPRATFIASAPLAIVVCGDTDKTMEGAGRAYWIQDCSAATENILIAANAMGLGSVWTANYPMTERVDAVRKALELPDNLIPLNTIAIGHPASEVTPKDKWKPENVSYRE